MNSFNDSVVRIYIPDTITFEQYKRWLHFSKDLLGITDDYISLMIDSDDEDWDEEDDWDEEEDEKQFYPVPVNEV
ncbi:MAG: hypothetical protein MJZ83_04620 [Bacteroidaceae bacterium]|nr:hypothetical protein [Bacteroidaceae bacterium]